MNENNLEKNDTTNAVIKNEMTSRDRYDIPLRKIASRDVTKMRSNITDDITGDDITLYSMPCD